MMKKRIFLMLSHPFLRSSALVAILSFFASIFSYVFNLVVVKMFPISAYGEYAAVNSYIGLLSVPIIAFGSIVIRRIGREKKSDRIAFIAALENWIQIQAQQYIIWICVAIGLLWIFSTRVGHLSSLGVGFIALSLSLLVFQSFYSNALQGVQRFGRYGSLLVITTLGKLVVGGVVVSIFHSLLGLYVAVLSTTGLSIAIGRRWILQRRKRVPMNIQFLDIVFYLRSPKTYIPLLTTIGLVGLSTVDVIVAKALLPATEAGLYGSLSLISKIILYLTMPIGTVAFVFFTDKDQELSQYRLLAGSLVIISIVGAISIAAYALVPKLIISYIASSSYFGITDALWAGALFGTLYSMVFILGNFLISKNHQLGSLSLVAMGIQVGLLLGFHATFLTMMLVNAFACFLLLILYGMVILTSAQK